MSKSVQRGFREFGEKMEVVAILTILGIFIPFLQLVNLILIFIALKKLKELNIELRSSFISEFRSKFIAAFLVRIIGIILIAFSFMFLIILLIFYGGFYITFLIAFGVLLLVGLIVLISGSVVEMKAWKELKQFFEKNRKMFPSHIADDVIKGCEQLKNGVLMFALSFLIITIIIGYIYQILGFFKLAELKDLAYHYKEETKENTPQEQLQYKTETSLIGSFCPTCGAKLTGEVRYCPECGANLLED
ncbi:MAG: membrane protein of unknown function [Promethearchaeota archaeon]|nr:MAG: membrane protein of unknown function [Candidatus Lokiarchaeota archaeon]